MDFHETVADVHTVAVSTGESEKVFVLTSDGWRCYRYSHSPTPSRASLLGL
jgi:hypothetical protein